MKYFGCESVANQSAYERCFAHSTLTDYHNLGALLQDLHRWINVSFIHRQSDWFRLILEFFFCFFEIRFFFQKRAHRSAIHSIKGFYFFLFLMEDNKSVVLHAAFSSCTQCVYATQNSPCSVEGIEWGTYVSAAANSFYDITQHHTQHSPPPHKLDICITYCPLLCLKLSIARNRKIRKA